MRALASGLVLAVLSLGCGPAHRDWNLTSPGIVADAGGVTVQFPDWLDRYPALRDEALLEVRAAGFPEGWTVQVAVPVFEARPGLLASGQTFFAQRFSLVGWRLDDSSLPVLPSAAYEAANARCSCESGGDAALAEIQADGGVR